MRSKVQKVQLHMHDRANLVLFGCGRCTHSPLISKRIIETPVHVTPELHFQLNHFLGAILHGFLPNCIRVFDIQMADNST